MRPTGSYGYGLIARLLHWLSAGLILSSVVLGLVMTSLPSETETQVALVLQSFSLHKTIGVTALALGLARIVWTTANPGPGPLRPDRRLETFVARLVHWLLWCALLILPVSGWLYHSAAPGFSSILWPFAQSLPFIPTNEALALVFRSIHGMSVWFLLGVLGLHILGALKHQIIDQDATLSRMMTGKGPYTPQARRILALPFLALAIWAAVIGLGFVTAPTPDLDPFATFDTDLTPLDVEPLAD